MEVRMLRLIGLLALVFVLWQLNLPELLFGGPSTAPWMPAAIAQESPPPAPSHLGWWAAWLGCVLLLPVVCLAGLRAVARTRSNSCIAFALIGFVAIAASSALSIVLISGADIGPLAWGAVLAGSAAYGFLALGFAANLER
jgi:hypothetical protein